MKNCAVVGAGMAGLTAAAELKRAGVDVVVLEKSRGLGGRLATRRFDSGSADHGAQYVTARDAGFQALMQETVFAGHATGWAPAGKTGDDPKNEPRNEPWLVGLEGMSGLVRPLSEGLQVIREIRVERIGSTSEGYSLQTDQGPQGPFDAVLVAIPAPQAAPLLEAHGKPFGDIAAAGMQPTLTGMFAFEARVPLEADYLASPHGDIATAVRNSSKAGRGGAECWVVHASHFWSRRNLELEREEIAGRILEFLRTLAGGTLPDVTWQSGHRWRHAAVETAVGTPCLVASNRRLAACGDWCLGPRVEAAYLSGIAAARALLEPS